MNAFRASGLALLFALAACDDPDERLTSEEEGAGRDVAQQLARANAEARANEAEAAAAGDQSEAPDCRVPATLPQTIATSVSSDLPLFVLDTSGKLFRAGFDGRAWELIADPGLKRPLHAQTTQDGRWILHGGVRKGEEDATWWLFDSTTGQDRRVPGPNRWEHLLSADGTTIARFGADGGGPLRVELVDTRDMGVVRIELAGAPGTKSDVGMPELAWTYDQKLVLRHPASGRNYTLDASRRWQPMAEKVHTQDWNIAPPNTIVIPSYAGRWHAMVHEPQGVLKVQTPEGDHLRVAEAFGDDCVGPRVRMLGWADGHRLLVYVVLMGLKPESADLRYYVFDTQARGNRLLFEQPEQVASVVWKDWGNPEPSPAELETRR